MALKAPAWERRYSNKINITDAIIVGISVFGAEVLRFGSAVQELNIPLDSHSNLVVDYTLLSVALSLGWLIALHLFDTRDPKVFGSGPVEYKRVINATFATFGTLAIVAFLLKSQIGRGYLLIALPAGLILLLLSRWAWRKRLHRQRHRGQNTYRTLIVGERKKIKFVASEIIRDKYAGFHLIGSVTERGTDNELLPDLPVLSNYDGLIQTIDECEADTVIITGADSLTPVQLRHIGWELETRRIDLIVAASLTDIAGPRIHTRPVSGMPLIHVEYPTFSGSKYFAKRLFDLFGSVSLLIVLSPLFLILSLIVKFDSSGPVHFKQNRVGVGGRVFKMLKFRSMDQDAEDQLPGLLDQSEGNNMLFKLKHDPRITRSGQVMRKYSLDELPQLVNVFLGEMSLVGPRPPLPREVVRYEKRDHRRLLVKPGITGLWQVSGRSTLNWEDSVRLDLYYVENWSLTGDLLLLWKTVKTVLRPSGAY